MNEYGLDTQYFINKLSLIIRDAENYTPDEMARELARLSITADKAVILESEFSGYAWNLVSSSLPKEEYPVIVMAEHIEHPFIAHLYKGKWDANISHVASGDPQDHVYNEFETGDIVKWAEIPK